MLGTTGAAAAPRYAATPEGLTAFASLESLTALASSERPPEMEDYHATQGRPSIKAVCILLRVCLRASESEGNPFKGPSTAIASEPQSGDVDVRGSKTECAMQIIK